MEKTLKRTTICETNKMIGQKIRLYGWVNTLRDQGGIKFLLLRDRSGLVQVIIKKGSKTEMVFQKLTLESIIELTGNVKKEEQAPGGFEIEAESIKILSSASDLPIPVAEKGTEETELQKRLNWRWLDLRKPKKQLIFKVWTMMEQAFREYWLNHGYLQIYSPKLMSTPSESGAELFEVAYFERKAYLAQSPQFYKQMAMAAGFEKVFEVGPVFRANPSFTSRHDTEFTMYDIEISFIKSHQDLIKEEERMLVAVLLAIKKVYGEEIKKIYGRSLEIPTIPFPQLTMAEAKKMLTIADIANQKADLSPEEERKICELIKKKYRHEFVFITEYPIETRPFYHMRLESNPSLTKSFDLLWNGIEITTGAQREHRLETLRRQAKEKGIQGHSLEYYFNFFKYGCPPHGGFAIGPTRMLMKIFGLPNVREVTYVYRGVKRLTP